MADVYTYPGLVEDAPEHEQSTPLIVQQAFDPPMGQPHPLRILVADDCLMKVFLRMLQRLGCHVDVVGNGIEVLEALQRSPYDVVLMDVLMPEMDGLEASRQIHAQLPPQRRPRLIAMSGHRGEEQRQRCLAAGMDDYLNKPVRIEELVAALQRCEPRWFPTSETEVKEKPPKEALDISNPIPASSKVIASVKEALQIGDDEPELIAEIIEVFREDAQQLIAELRQAINEGTHQKMLQAAHSLKGRSNCMGLTSLAAICKALKEMGRQGTLEGVAEKMSELEAEYERIENALKEEPGDL